MRMPRDDVDVNVEVKVEVYADVNKLFKNDRYLPTEHAEYEKGIKKDIEGDLVEEDLVEEDTVDHVRLCNMWLNSL